MKSLLSGLAIALACLQNLSVASIEVGDDIKLYRGPGNVGGVFYVDDLNDPNLVGTTYDFGTFCVEITETIRLGSSYIYDVYKVGAENDKNGPYDPLSLGTKAAWLYTQYRDTTSAYHISIGENQHNKANAMQLGIWRSMGYSDYAIRTAVGWSSTYLMDLTDDYLSGWLTNFDNDWAWRNHGPDYTGGVQIMNLTTESGAYAQDQLIWSPVPEPATLLVWTGLIAVGACAATRARHSVTASA